MYCRNCGNQVGANAAFCSHCGAVQNTEHVVFVQRTKPLFYNAGFVLGILSICLFFGWGFILGLIGLPLACISKRKSAIILNIIGLVLGLALWVGLFWLLATIEPWEWPYPTEFEQLLRSV